MQIIFTFYDAAAPIIEKDSIDFTKAYRKSRYDKGDADYINCAMNEEEFDRFYDELIHAETAELHDIDKEIYFEGCMPVEEIARRGRKTLLFGPMKPVGLERPDGSRPYAVVQLRQDNAVDTLYNVVGFQTHLKWGEQKRLLSMIPGLENCRIVRYGVMHRNSYLCAPRVLRETYQCVQRDDLFFAGQMCGVEGYVESAASGLIAGINMARLMKGEAPVVFPNTCIMGSMAYYITHAGCLLLSADEREFRHRPAGGQGEEASAQGSDLHAGPGCDRSAWKAAVMEDYLARFLQYVHQRNSGSAHTLDAYRRDIEQFFAFLHAEGIESLEDVDRIVLMNYIASLRMDEQGRHAQFDDDRPQDQFASAPSTII